ncbi:MAG TPA: RHS repeat-associated core domain-containing protein [Candidatus Sulfotelmatobacter sp.]|nr:RHS repeat-associated core domain-containing protein [Candidatus Sulfotelmatobacter sp.]
MNIKTSIGITLAICFAGLVHVQAQTNLIQQILQMKTFREGLVLTGTNQPTDAENKELLEVLTHLNESWWRAGLEQFFSDYPNSPWAVSLHYDYACFCRRTGRTTKALENYEAAWNLAKNDTDPEGQRLSGTVLANWTDLLSSLGRLEKLKELIAIGDNWYFVNSHDRDMFQGAKDSYYLMRDHPGIAYRCGTFALKSVGEELEPTNRALETLVQIPSPTNGFSMANLMDISKKYGLNLVAVRRTAGQDLIVPSVVHWRQNHYAAILQKQDDLYLVSDPTFGNQKWMPADVINEEASGEFLVPASSQPDGWIKLARNETEKIHGMGLPNNINDNKDKCCVRLFNGTVSCSQCGGMPIWWVSEPYINLWLQDQPLAYMTSRGQPFGYQVTFKQRGGWANSWQSTATMTGLTPCGGDECSSSFYNSDVTITLPNGGQVYFPTTNGTAFNYCPPRYDSETRLMIQPVLTNYVSETGADDGSYGLRLVHADGSQDIYQINLATAIAGDYPNSTGNLVRHIDANGDTTWFQYATFNQATTVLGFVIDPDGRTNYLTYTPSGLLTNITNPYGLTAKFKYDSHGNLTNIIDAQGLSSSITYDTNNYPTSLITPYGTTTFSLVDNGISYSGGTLGNAGGDDNGLIDRSALVVDPTGATNLYMYRYDAEMVMPSSSFTSDVPTGTPLGTLDTGAGANAGTNSAVWFRNSFHWGPMQYAHLSTQNMTNFTQSDYLLARMQHWLQDTDELYITGYVSVERDPSPDGVNPGPMTFFDYRGKTYNDQAGTYALPSVRAWQLPDGTTYYDYLLFDYFGNITNWISTYTLPTGGIGTRTNQFIYANNTYSYSFGQSYGTGITYLYTTYYTVPDLLAEVIGADGNPIWSYGGFDTVSWTNIFYVGAGEGAGGTPVGTNGTMMTSSRILPDYATNGLQQVATTTYTSQGMYVPYGDLLQGTVINGDFYTNYYYGTLTAYSYSGGNRVTSFTSVAGLTTTNVYNTNGFLVQTIDEQVGRTNSFGYENNGLIGAVTNELGLNLAGTWDNLLRLTSIQYPDGTYVSNVYSKLDITAQRDRLGNWSYYGYDGDRHLIAITNANSAVTTYDWCGCGALTAIIDALTNVTTFNYNNQGNLTNITYPDGSEINYAYSSVEWPTNVFDGAGRSIQLAFDNQGLITTVDGAYGQIYNTTYDIRDRQLAITDANGVTVTNSYDLIDELLSQTGPGGMNDRFAYAARGLIAATNSDNQPTQYGRDVAGRLTAITNANNEVVRVAYNPSDEIVSLIDGLNHTNSWQYNQYGWLTNKVDGLGRNAFRYAYNPNGWLTNRWTPEKGNTFYTFDNVGNLKSIIYPQLIISYDYDAINELTSMVDASGTNSFTYAYGLLASETGPWPTDTVSYGYSQGLQTELNLSQPGNSWSQTYDYDGMWRMTNVSSPAGTFAYSYNFKPASSLVSGITLPNGAAIANSYDVLARLTQTIFSNHWGHVLDGYTYQYDPLGLRTNVLRNFGLTSSSVSVGFDNIGQLTSWTAQETNGVARLNEQLGFGFDAAHNLHTRTSGNLTQTFNADAENELTSVTRSGTLTVSGATPAPATNILVNGQAAQTYGDFTFARTNISLISGNNTFTNVAQNVYGVTITNTFTINLPSSVTLNYDNNGNLTNDGTRAFGYDSENQLTNITVTGQWRSDFIYDGLNRRRIVRDYAWNGSGWTETNEIHYVYDGDLVIQERDTNNNVLATFTRGLDLSGDLWDAGGIGGLLARTDTNGSTFYHSDGAGNVTALMDSEEDIVARYLYNPFGKLLGQWGSLANGNDMQFSSMPQHDGLAFYRFRPYEPNYQRWLSQDPIRENGGINLYQFAANNPLYWIDPLGLDPLGHHLVPKSIWDNPQTSQRIKDIWDSAKNRLDSKNYVKKNGPTHNGKSYGPKNGPKVRCKDYSKAVNDELDKYLEDKGAKSVNDLTDQEAQDFADQIRNTTDGDIGAYNQGVADEIAASDAAAADGAAAAETAEALTTAVEVDEAVEVTAAVVK